MNKDNLLECLNISIKKLYENDVDLIKNKSSERCIISAFQCYLKDLEDFVSYKIDVEYNREWDWHNSKRNEKNEPTTADLLIHTRRDKVNGNLLYLEAKTFFNISDENRTEDIDTIQYFMSKFNYSYGIFVCFYIDRVEYILFYGDDFEEWIFDII